jgi:hypothetical protein
MNERDRENLNFLLNSSADTLSLWYSQVSIDDIHYAEDLLNVAEIELQDLQVVTKEDCVDAQQILKKFIKVI